MARVGIYAFDSTSEYTMDRLAAFQRLPGGKLMVFGSAKPAGGSYTDVFIARLTATGQLDTTFGAGKGYILRDFLGVNDFVSGVHPVGDGQFIIDGSSATVVNGTGSGFVAKISADGGTVAGFGNDAVHHAFTDSSFKAGGMQVLSDGAILVAGNRNVGGTEQFSVLRLTAAGTLDAGFGTGGYITHPHSQGGSAYGIELDGNGQAVVSGVIDMKTSPTSRDQYIIRINPQTGIYDSTLDGDGILNRTTSTNAVVAAAKVIPDGRIAIAELYFTSGGNWYVRREFLSSTGVDSNDGYRSAFLFAVDPANDSTMNLGVLFDGMGTPRVGGYVKYRNEAPHGQFSWSFPP